jgi:TonB-dependent starch-binding outer membrane protein SusC
MPIKVHGKPLTVGQWLPILNKLLRNLHPAMRLTTIFLLLGCLQVSARGGAQTITLSLKNAPVEQAFRAIEKQTDYRFVYTKEDIQKANLVNIQANNINLTDALNLCFQGQPIMYVLNEKFIVVKNREVKAPADFYDTENTTIDVKGKVTNEKGEPVEGVTVTIKGTNKFTSTDKNGDFSLSSVDKEAILVFTSVNMETFEIKVNDKDEIAVRLKAKVSELGGVEVVSINTGYQTLPKERATGSFSQPDKTMFNARVSTDVISKLEGIVSGLVFNRSTSGATTLSIRGRSTIIANSTPLIVVDNFPYDGDLNNLNPNDIETITLLKDAAAASIWGARAGNGVLVITTKKGKLNQPLHVDFNSNFSVSAKPNLFYDQNFLTSREFINVESFLFDKGYYSNATYLNNTTSRLPISPVVEILNKRKLGLITPIDSSNSVDFLKNIDVRNELGRYFYQRATNQQYSLSMSGGSNKVGYMLSAGFDKNIANQVGNAFNRVTINSLTTFQLSNKLEASLGINLIESNSTVNSTLSDVTTGGSSNFKRIYPYAQFSDVNESMLPIVKDFRKSWIDTVGGGKYLNWEYYPLSELKLWDNTSKVSDIRLNPGIKYMVIDGLSFEFKYQYQKGSSNIRVYYSPESYFSRNLVNQYSAIVPNPLSPAGQASGILYLNNIAYISNNARGQINYVKRVKDHELNMIAGVDVREIKRELQGASFYGYNDINASFQNVNYSSIYNLFPSGSATIPNKNSLGGTVNRFRSYFSNLAYVYKTKYVLSLSGRIDQTNLFGVQANQKAVPLWSVGTKAEISKETFYNVTWLPFLQLRLTYGFNGNTITDGTAYTTASYNTSATTLQPPFATIQSPGNPQLTWEKIRIINLGIDFAILRNVVSGSIEYYNKRGSGIIGENVVPSSTGFTSAKGNFSNISGKGMDLVLRSVIFNGRFKWTNSLLLSYARDEITKYAGSASTSLFLEGKPVRGIYSYAWAGLDPVTGDPRGFIADTVSKAYSVLSNQLIKDQVYNGPADPVIFGGLQNTFTWNGISLSFNLAFKFGYYFRRSSLNYTSLFANWQGNQELSSRWQKPGDEKFTNVPSMVFPSNPSRDQFYNNSEINVVKGDNMRLQDVSISYSLRDIKISKISFNSLQFYIYANNIAVLWKANKFGIDPDFQVGYPAPRIISLGFKSRF